MDFIHQSRQYIFQIAIFADMEDTMIIQPHIRDIDGILNLWETMVDESYPLRSYDERILQARSVLKGKLELLPTIRILKNRKGVIVAFIRVSDEVISSLYVHPMERRKGYASQLVGHVLEHMRITGVRLRNPENCIISFYRKFGFRPEDNITGHNRKVYLVRQH